MSLRAKWEFQYTARAIGDAIKAQIKYHAERQVWWAGERNTAEAKIKEKGLQVREHQFSGGADIEVVVDATLGKRLGECNKKIEINTRMAVEFSRWAAAVASWPKDQTHTLDIDDVEYFGL